MKTKKKKKETGDLRLCQQLYDNDFSFMQIYRYLVNERNFTRGQALEIIKQLD